jgi:hypothetical protein
MIFLGQLNKKMIIVLIGKIVDVGWVGTKWKPTIFQRCRFTPTHPTLANDKDYLSKGIVI